MRAWWLAPAAMAAMAAMAAWSAQAPAGDPLLRAMHDEIERSRTLTVPNLEAPYFIEYVVDDEDSFSVAAQLGSLDGRRRDHFREAQVHVRVGDYKFDNTNFGGGGGFGTRYDLGRFPLENSYPVLRRYFWLATDSAYKAAVEAISRKRAALRNVTQNQPLDDFAHAEPLHSLRDFEKLAIDEEEWSNRVRALSAIFDGYPALRDSRVDLDASAGGFYLVNTEGSEVREPETVVVLRMRGVAQAPDGMMVRDGVAFHAMEAARLPGEAELRQAAKDMAAEVTALAAAPKGEEYTGPVLFEGQASPQMFAQALGRNLVLGRRLTGGRGGNAPTSDLEGRIGARVLPDSFTVVDDPTQKEWHGQPLFGSYQVDRQGVAPGPLRLVEKGMLKGYLLTRQPVRGFAASNGRARLPGGINSTAAISNLFISSSDTVPSSTLKAKLIELIQQRDKPYGILVRKLDFPSIAPADEVRRMLGGGQAVHPVSAPVMIYKVYPDGREELVRGLRFSGFNARSLRDILTAGDDSTVFRFMDNAAPFAMIGASGYTSEACVIAPAVLIDDLELAPSEDELPKLPLAPAPEITH